MGLDSVELIIAFEKTFDIKIPDKDAERLTTVGETSDYIWSRVEKRQSSKCFSQFLFYKFRKSLIEKTDLPKEYFKRDTKLNEIIPLKKRKIEYGSLEKSVGLKLPELTLNAFWQSMLIAFGSIVILGGLLYALAGIFLSGSSNKLFFIPITGVILTILFSQLLNPKRIFINPPLLGDFIKKTMALNYSDFSERPGLNRKEVEEIIKHVIVDKIGVSPDEVRPEKSFPDDLGIH